MSHFVVFVRRLVSWMCAIALCCSASCLAFADASSASLRITVSDTSGAVIQEAMAALRNSDTNQLQTSVSNKSGNASFPFLKPGHYCLTVSKGGFSDVTVDGILLNVGDERHLQLVLKVGAANQNVTVDGSGQTINTTDASVSTVIDRQFVANIPLNGRSFQDLISMTPGVVTQSPNNSGGLLGQSGNFSVNGQRTESNYYTIDGVTGNLGVGTGNGAPSAATGGSVPSSTALGTTQSLVSVDALEEFRVQSSTYSAEFGRSPGGQFSLMTRSGTNGLHGVLFDYLRNNFFDANNWFNDLYQSPTPALRQNDFGGTLGGPIRMPFLYDGKNRSFFFVSYEGLRLTLPQAASVEYVPSLSLRGSAPQNIQPLLNAFALPTGQEVQVACSASTTPCPSGVPTGTLVPSGLATLIASYSSPSQIDSTSIRLDHKVNDKLALFFRIGYTPSTSVTRPETPSAVQRTTFSAQSYTLGATSQLTPSLTNQFRALYSDSGVGISGYIDSFGGAQPIDIFSSIASATEPHSQGEFYMSFSGVGQTYIVDPHSANKGINWNIVDSASYSRGGNLITVGVDFLRIRSSQTPSAPQAVAYYTNKNPILAGTAGTLFLYQYLPSTSLFYESAAFIQDEFTLTPRLHLSGGLRWEADPPPTGINGNDAFTLLGNTSNPASLTLAPRGTSLWRPTYLNFSPRLGIAWTAHATPGRETIVRAGGGAFYDTDNTIAAQGFSSTAIGFGAHTTYSNEPLPAPESLLNFTPSTSPPFSSSTAYAFPRHLQLPYTLQWNLSIQQALGESQTFTLSYVAANGRRLLGAQQMSVASLNPNFSIVYWYQAHLTSNYQSLQGQFQRTLRKGLQALASYTWSHALDYGSTASTITLTRGNSDFDVRSNFQGGISYDVPEQPWSHTASALLNHWAIDGRLMSRSAFPITLKGNLFVNSATGTEEYGGLNIVPDQPFYRSGNGCTNLPKSVCPGGRAINKSAFSVPSSGVVGNAPRNFLRGFGMTQVNLAARREFPVHDSFSLQFRAEVFNLLNHPMFGYVDPTYSDATFGQATQTLNSSLLTVASQYQQGGPRSLQFALKLNF